MITEMIVLAALCAPGDGALTFERTRIGDTVFEACGVFDVDKDGHLDILSGSHWHRGPHFTESHFVADVQRMDQDYYDDFSDWHMDVNGDGYDDVITGAWWSLTLRWRENPGEKGGDWTTHDIATIGNIERICFFDVDGDGHIEVVPNTPGKPQQIFKLNRGANGKGDGTFTRFTANPAGSGHGNGFGDINGDGRGDIVLHNGWLEQPAKPFAEEWPFHQEYELGNGASVPILVHDVNGDNKMDLIVGHGHGYGLWWWEQGGDGSARTWTQHVIEEDRAQFHTMNLADIDDDGDLELITGKRWRAHNGGDPGADDPLGLYYYEIDGGKFTRTTIDYGPAESTSGTGLHMAIIDIDGNGWLDIVAPGKEGLYLFRNQGRQ